MMHPSDQPLDPSPEKGPCPRKRLLLELLKRVNPRNLRVAPGVTRIALDRNWPRMLSGLVRLGVCLRVSRSRAAVLGVLGSYPGLEFATDGSAGRSCACSLGMEFTPWDSAMAVAEERGCCAAHYLDFCDGNGEVLHRICLSEESDLGAYLEWVLLHQGTTEGPPCGAVRPFVYNRWRTVPQRHWFDYEEVFEVPPVLVGELFDAARRGRVPLDCVVANHAVMQAAEFIPQAVRPVSNWTFASDDRVGLHFDPAAFSSVLIHQSAEAGSPGLKAFDDSGGLCLSIARSCATPSADWSDFLRRTTDAPIS